MERHGAASPRNSLDHQEDFFNHSKKPKIVTAAIISFHVIVVHADHENPSSI
jgi:hypothetical protein